MLLKGKTILITEDNPINRTMFQMSIIQEGGKVIFDRFGPLTVNLVKGLSNVDLIVLDLMLMRGVSGYDVFQEIRNLPNKGDIPIVAVSAAEASEAIKKCQELGFDGYIAKPINERKFPMQLYKVLNGESLWVAR